jgi:anaerobic selenocysteine-containing dehydrogenase
MSTHKTFCRFCHAYCAIEVDVEDGVPVAVRGDTSDPVYSGYTCIKGRQLPDQFTNPGRVRKPLKRMPDGSYQEIDLQVALDEIGGKVKTLLDDNPRGVATYIGSYGFQNSAALHIAKSWHKSVGSTSYYTSVTIDQPAKQIAWSRVGYWGGGSHSFTDADVVMLIGNNAVVSQYSPFGGIPPFSPYKRLRDEIKKGMKVITVDPRKTEVANRSHIHMQINPGKDATLLAGMINIILSEGLEDTEFCNAYVQDLDSFRSLVTGYSPTYVAQQCGIPEEQLFEATRLFAAGPRGVASAGTGPDMASHAVLTEHLIVVLNLICGRVNREGERFPNPGMMTPEIPRRAEVIPPSPVFGIGPKSRFRGLGEVFGEMPTATLNDEILEDGEGQIKALFCMGGNPMVAFPDQDKTKRAMDKLELLVCIDIVRSATSKLADYILPPTLSLERDDVTMLTDVWYDEPYSHYTEAILEKNPQSLEEWEFYWEMSQRLGIPIDLPGGQLGLETCPTKFEALELLTPGAKVPVADIRAKPAGHLFEQINITVEAGSNSNSLFQLEPDGVAEEMQEILAEPVWTDGKIIDDDKEYSHLLISRRLKHYFNSSGHTLPALMAKGTTNYAYMNPSDLAEMSIEAGQLVEISASAGSLVGVAEAANDVKPGTVSMAHAFGDLPGNFGDVREVGSSTNRLVDDDRTYCKISGMPRMSAIPVNLRVVAE